MVRLVKQTPFSYAVTALSVALLVYISAAGDATMTTDALIAVVLAVSGLVLSQAGGLMKTESEPQEREAVSAAPWVVIDLLVIFSLNYFVPRVPLSLVSLIGSNLNVGIAFQVLEAVAEEQFFRGFFLNFFLSRVDPYTAIVADGALFGVYHFFVYGYSPNLIVLVMMAGMVLAYSDWRLGNIDASMIAHVLNNLF